MPLALYMDVHVPKAIADQLQLRGIDVLTAQADNAEKLIDDELLDRATALGRILFTRDDDFIRIAAERQSSGTEFAGIVFAHQLDVSIGRCVGDLELIATACEPVDLQNRLEYLPL